MGADRALTAPDRMRAPAVQLVRRFLVALAGTCVVLVGLVLVPLPGPGWPIVFLGFALLGSEFAWADRLRSHVQRRVAGGIRWSAGASWPVRASLSAAMVGSLLLPFVVLVPRA